MSTTPSRQAGKPPQSYRLDETTIVITRHPGRSPTPIRRLSIAGTGAATLEQNGQKHAFRYATTDLLAVLNNLYAIRFFDLAGDYTTRRSVFLKDDGTIVTTMLRMVDEPSTTVCVSATSFEKCVSYGAHAPDTLENIVARVFSDAETLSSTPPK